jgi:hypothetical protein
MDAPRPQKEMAGSGVWVKVEGYRKEVDEKNRGGRTASAGEKISGGRPEIPKGDGWVGGVG